MDFRPVPLISDSIPLFHLVYSLTIRTTQQTLDHTESPTLVNPCARSEAQQSQLCLRPQVYFDLLSSAYSMSLGFRHRDLRLGRMLPGLSPTKEGLYPNRLDFNCALSCDTGWECVSALWSQVPRVVAANHGCSRRGHLGAVHAWTLMLRVGRRARLPVSTEDLFGISEKDVETHQ